MIERALRLTREFHRMKQVELAKKLGISTSYLSEIEAGKKPASLELLDGYARVFKVPASTFLLFGERAGPSEDARRRARAEQLLKFFEWVSNEEDDERTGDDEAEAPRATEKAVPLASVRAVRP